MSGDQDFNKEVQIIDSKNYSPSLPMPYSRLGHDVVLSQHTFFLTSKHSKNPLVSQRRTGRS